METRPKQMVMLEVMDGVVMDYPVVIVYGVWQQLAGLLQQYPLVFDKLERCDRHSMENGWRESDFGAAFGLLRDTMLIELRGESEASGYAPHPVVRGILRAWQKGVKRFSFDRPTEEEERVRNAQIEAQLGRSVMKQ